MQDAINAELIATNPFHGWCFAKKEEVRERYDIDPFSKDEQAVILASLDARATT